MAGPVATPPAQPAAPVPAPPAATLASLYDVHDPVFEYQVPDTKVAAAATSGATPAAQSPVQPAAVPPQTAVPPVVPAPSEPKHHDWVLRYATDLGVHPLIVERLGKEDLTQYVMAEMAKARQNASSNQATATITGRGSQPPAPVTPSQPAEPVFDWGVHDDVEPDGRIVKKQFTDEMVHPAVASHIKAQEKRIRTLESKIDGMIQGAQQQHTNRVANEFDAAFNKLGGMFGVGNAQTLEGSQEKKYRAIVFGAVKGMYDVLPPDARANMTIEKAVFSQARAMFGVEPPVAAAATQPQGNGRPTPEQFRTGGVAPPTQRRGDDNPNGRDRAIAEAQAWWSEQVAQGGSPAVGDTSMDEFLPF